MFITKDILYAGVNDHQVDLFEGQYTVPNGMAYNSYVILDDKIAVMDTVDRHFQHEWLDNLALILGGRKPDYLVVQHMEPDHSANIASFLSAYPEAAVVANAKTFAMIDQFFGPGLCENKVVVKDGESLSLGKHTLTFVFAPMVHWPEVMVTYDSTDKVLFSADGFGKFGALDAQTRTQLQTELLETWEREKKTCFFITHDVEEAIILAQRVIIMSARPGRIKDIVDVNIPYPRTQETKLTPEFNELKNHIWSQVYQEYLAVRK